MIFYFLSDPGLRKIPCYTLLHHIEVFCFECCKILASVIGNEK